MTSSYHLQFSIASPASGGGGSGGGGGEGGSSSIPTQEVIEEGCTESWVCESWSACTEEKQIRHCVDWNSCGTENFKPLERKECKIEQEKIFDLNDGSKQLIILDEKQRVAFMFVDEKHYIEIDELGKDYAKFDV